MSVGVGVAAGPRCSRPGLRFRPDPVQCRVISVALSSVLSRNDRLQKMFADRFGEAFRTVGDYYAVHAGAVQIEDVSPCLSELAEELIAEPDAGAES